MPWASVVGAGLSIAGGIFGSKKADKAARRAQEQEARFRQQELDLANNQFQFAKDQYGDWKAKADPLYSDVRGMLDDVEPDYNAIAGDVNMAFDAQQGAERRNMRRYGIKPTDGAARAGEREWGIRKAGAHVGARSQARQGAKDKRFGRYADLYNSLQGIGTNNASMVTGAMANQQAAYGNAANAARGDSRYYADRADQSAAGWGQIIGGIDWGGIWNSAKGWFNQPGSSGGGTMPTVPQ